MGLAVAGQGGPAVSAQAAGEERGKEGSTPPSTSTTCVVVGGRG